LPSQVPSRPQLAAGSGGHWSGRLCPTVTGVQVPADPARSQAMHVPVQAVAQQTAWAQIPDWHRPPAVQGRPLTSRAASAGAAGASRSTPASSAAGASGVSTPTGMGSGGAASAPVRPGSGATAVGAAGATVISSGGRVRSTQPTTSIGMVSRR